MPPGGLVRLEGDDGGASARFMFNPHSLIAARLLDRDPDAGDRRRLGAARASAAAIGAARAHVRHAVPSAGACRGRLPARADHRPLRRRGRAAGQLRRDGPADAGDRRGADGGAARCAPSSPATIRAARAQEGLPEKVALLHGTDATAAVRGRRRAVRRSIRWRARRPAGSSTSGATATASPRWPPARGCWTCSAMSAPSACAAPPPARRAVTLVDSSAPALEQARGRRRRTTG